MSSIHETIPRKRVVMKSARCTLNISLSEKPQAPKLTSVKANPPPRGVGFVWLDRSFGLSTISWRFNIFSIRPVVRKLAKAVVKKREIE